MLLHGLSVTLASLPRQPFNEAKQRTKPFSDVEIQQLRTDGTPVLPISPQVGALPARVNKKSTLQNQKVMDRFKALGVELRRADWSRQDPEITKALASFGRNGVPLYVYYPRKAAPVVLPEILTPSPLWRRCRNRKAQRRISADRLSSCENPPLTQRPSVSGPTLIMLATTALLSYWATLGLWNTPSAPPSAALHVPSTSRLSIFPHESWIVRVKCNIHLT